MTPAASGPVSREEILRENLRLHEGTADQYDEVHYYLRNRVEQFLLRRDLARFQAWLTARLGRQPHVLDLGCGTGNLSLKLLDNGARVTGIDLSPAMVAQVRRKAASLGRGEAFTAVVGSADELAALAGADHLMPAIDAVCVSSVLHHLFDYLEPLRQLRTLAPGLAGIFVTHEPLVRTGLRRSGRFASRYNEVVRNLDVGLSRRIQRPVERVPDSPIADYHAFKDGIDPLLLAREGGAMGLTRCLIRRRYNMRRTTTASLIDNLLAGPLRNDIFPITMFTLALVRP